ncbi:MAG: protein kinase [Kofleriaceae bacterium]|nr:protein kinase [Kofleriaceae bacterium]
MSEEASLDDTLAAPPVRDVDYPEMQTVDPAHYVVADELARGGMGRIRVARDRRLGRRIALKEILVQRGDLARRFEREARITARLEHPSIVSVHEAGAWPTGEPFIAMRLVKGRSLDEVIEKAPGLAARMALLPNVLAIADAIAYAHEQRVVHRDLKPKNVLIGSYGETVVIDWGLAKDLTDGTASEAVAPDSSLISGTEETLPPPVADSDAPTAGGLTVTGAVMGTPAYMPPEQALGEQVDERADVYAIGAILYHVLAGRPPVTARTSAGALADVISGRIPGLATVEPNVPVDLLAIVDKAMAANAAARYPTARELAEDLRRFQTGQLVGAHDYSFRQIVAKWLRRHRAIVSIVALALVVLSIGAVVAVRQIIAEREAARAAQALAERSRADADGLVTFMLGDVLHRMEALGKLDALDTLTQRAVDHYAKAASRAAEQTASHASALMTRAAVLEAQNNLAGGVALVRQAIDVRTALLVIAPDDGARQRELASSYRKLTDMLNKQGDPRGALAAAERGLGLMQDLYATHPGNAEYARDLAGAQSKMGDAQRRRGQMTAAREHYLAALALRMELARKAPDDLDRQRDAAIGHDRVGSFLQEQGDLDGALAAYRTALGIAEPAVARDSTRNRQRRRDLWVLHSRIGDLLAQRADHDGALTAYRSALDVAQSLREEAPSSVQYARDLSITHASMGRVLLAKGDRAGALEELRADMAIAQRLATQDPTNGEWQRDLSVSHESIGDLLFGNGDTAGALDAYKKSATILKKLAAADATNQRWAADLAKTNARLAELQAAKPAK